MATKSKKTTPTKKAAVQVSLSPEPEMATAHHQYDPASFKRLVDAVQARFNVAQMRPLFMSGISGHQLWSAYLSSFPAASRQSHNCRACQKFITTFGGIVTIDPATGKRTSALWNEKDCKVSHQTQEYKDGFAAMRILVESAPIEGTFVTGQSTLGIPKEGGWLHFSVKMAAAIICKDLLRTPHQIMAAKLEDFRTVTSAAAEYAPEVIKKALGLLESGILVRSEKFLNPAKWLLNVSETIREGSRHHFDRDAEIWHLVAMAPAGFCHPRSGVLGSLLDDIKSDMHIDAVKRRFTDKLDPMEYQRPKAAPSEQTIDKAEEIFAKLGLERALDRRFATTSDLMTLWKATSKPMAPKKGMFADIRTSAPESGGVVVAGNITWSKFRRTVLDHARSIQVHLDHASGSYVGLMTATHSEAPPLFQWEDADYRYPVSWYFHRGPTSTASWGLSQGWHDVLVVTPKPNMYCDRCPSLGDGAILVVKGMHEDPSRATSLAVFPETLRSELHPVRSVIERVSNSRRPSNHPSAGVAGVMIGQNIDRLPAVTVKVTTDTGTAIYKIDRWE